MFISHLYLIRPHEKLYCAYCIVGWTGCLLSNSLYENGSLHAESLSCAHSICVVTGQMNDICHLGPATSGVWHQMRERWWPSTLQLFIVCHIKNVLHVSSVVSICSCLPKPSLSSSSSLPLSLVFYFCSCFIFDTLCFTHLIFLFVTICFCLSQ